MSTRSDLSGYSGPRLGLGLDSGWSHLSARPATPPSPAFGDDAMDDFDFDQIASDAVDEVFGFRGGGRGFAARHPVAAFRATHPRIAARRDYLRAGWGSPGWQASSYYDSYADPYVEEEAYLEEEPEEDYGPEAPEEEYGRRGGGRPVRRAIRRHRRAKKARRRGFAEGVAAASGYRSAPAEAEALPYEGEYEEEDGDVWYPDEEFGQQAELQPVTGVHAPGCRCPRCGFLPAPRQTTFRSALDTGLGFGLGFLGVALGINLLASALSGGRR